MNRRDSITLHGNTDHNKSIFAMIDLMHQDVRDAYELIIRDMKFYPHSTTIPQLQASTNHVWQFELIRDLVTNKDTLFQYRNLPPTIDNFGLIVKTLINCDLISVEYIEPFVIGITIGNVILQEGVAYYTKDDDNYSKNADLYTKLSVSDSPNFIDSMIMFLQRYLPESVKLATITILPSAKIENQSVSVKTKKGKKKVK